MITQTKARTAWAKKLAVLPMLCFFVACFSDSSQSFGQEFVRKGNTVKYKGNIIEMSGTRIDTVFVTDQNSGRDSQVVRWDGPTPVKFNGRKVWLSANCATKPAFKDKSQTFFKYCIEPFRADLEQLPDGFYQLDLNNVLIGPDGKLDYYDFNGIEAIRVNPLQEKPKGTIDTKIDAAAKKKIDAEMKKMVDKFPTVTPATVEGVKVPCLWNEVNRRMIMIVNHKLENHWDEK